MTKFDVDAATLMVGPFTRIARAMAREHHVEVIASGTECKTDGTRIYIPFTSDNLPEGDRQILHGMLDHEIAHVVEERVHKDAERKTPLELIAKCDRTTKMFFNVFEDIRIENKWGARYPGVLENLERKNKHFFDAYLKKKPEEIAENALNRLGLGVIARARGFGTTWLDSETARYLDVLGDEIAEIKSAQWGEDALRIAERALAKLRSAAMEIKEEEEEKLPLVFGVEEGGGEEDCDKGIEGKGDSTAAKLATEILEGEATVESFDSPGKDLMGEKIKYDIEVHGRYVPDPRLRRLDTWAPPKASEMMPIDDYDRARSEVASQIGALRGRQLALLQTISRKRFHTALPAGDVDESALFGVACGERDVFGEVRKGRTLDTAISVLLDLSGSTGNPHDSSRAAYWIKRIVIALVESWEPLRIPSEVVGFHNEWGRMPPPSGDKSVVQRSPFEFLIFKGWDERLAGCRRRFTAIKGRGDNADGEAVLAAAKRLAARPQKRKILITVSDGQPACGSIDPSKLARHLCETVKMITSTGIEVVAFGAGTDAPKQFYNTKTGAHNVCVNDLSQMARVVFRVMDQLIRKG